MTRTRRAAGIRVPGWAPRWWPGWFAPERQPFVTDALPPADRAALPAAQAPAAYDGEVRDSFWIYDELPRVWLTESEFADLDRGVRTRLVRRQLRVHQSVGTVRRAPAAVREAARAQADGHRFVWWPSLVGRAGLAPVIEVIETGVVPSAHRDVPTAVWRRAADVLPAARELAGTFADRSGPNCFGTVLAAAGVPRAALDWTHPEPFTAWLDAHTRPGGRDEDPGTVLVWHDDGVPVHAAVTLGGGWALNKPSQAWSSPRFVWTVRRVIAHSRYRGCRLRRRTITG